MRQLIDLTGQVFGKITVLYREGYNKYGHIKWLCRCECGKEKLIAGHDLRNGTTKSCGCARRERNIKHCGEKAPGWKGGRYKDHHGYIQLYKADHPNADKHHYISEHIFVMSQIIGRPLEKGETVHHKNGIRDDNEPSNLELRVSNHGFGQDIKDLVPYWKTMLNLYESIVNKL